MKELTIEESVKLHRELWNWLAENPEMNKRDWPGWEDLWAQHPGFKRIINRDNSSLTMLNCFACYMTSDDGCDRCMLKWPGINCCSDERDDDKRGLYARWERARAASTRKKLAIQIRDLPVRELANLVGTEEEEAGK